MKMKPNVFSLLVILALPAASQASTIQYVVSGDLSLASGSDATYGLDGAHYMLVATFTQANYSNYFGFPVLVADSADVTISGASNASLNGVFDLFCPAAVCGADQTPFFTPDNNSGVAYIGYTPGGVPLVFTQSGLGVTNMHPSFVATPTATGSLANPGDMAQASDFSPATAGTNVWSDFAGTTYNAINQTISDTIPTTTVPEPSSFMLLATGLGMAAARRHHARTLTKGRRAQ